MANLSYPKYRQALMDNGVDIKDSTIKGVLIDTGAYTYSAAHDFLDDVPSAARIGTPQTLQNKTITNGVLDADDITFSNVTAGTGSAATVEALLLYRDTGTEATSELIALYDTVSGLPLALNGSSVKITWDATGIIALVG